MGWGWTTTGKFFGREALAWEPLGGYVFSLWLSPIGRSDFGRFR
jgi:hypothetical protein